MFRALGETDELRVSLRCSPSAAPVETLQRKKPAPPSCGFLVAGERLLHLLRSSNTRLGEVNRGESRATSDAWQVFLLGEAGRSRATGDEQPSDSQVEQTSHAEPVWDGGRVNGAQLTEAEWKKLTEEIDRRSSGQRRS